MASGVYNKGCAELGTMANAWATAAYKVMLLKSSYTYNRDNVFVSDVVANEVTATGYARKAIAGPTVTLDATNDCAWVDANDISFSGITPNSDIVGYIVLYRDTGADATSPLIACWKLVPFTIVAAFTHVWNASGLLKIYSAT